MSKQEAGIRIGKKAFLSSMVILLVLMLGAGILTRVVTPGAFQRVEAEGRIQIVPGTYAEAGGADYPIWRWLTAPVEVLWSEDGMTVIAIILFIFIIGGVFATLDKSGMLRYIMTGLVRRFEANKYRLMAILILFFMFFGSVFGLFEELVALVPIVILLSYALGWDSLTGLGMSALAAGFGFSAATLNPFTLGIAQQLAGLPAFSGLLLRIPFFLLCYGILYIFVRRYAKGIEHDPRRSAVYAEDAAAREKYTALDLGEAQNPRMKQAVRVFGVFLALVILYILLGFVVRGLSDYSLPVMALLFLAGGLLAARTSRYAKTIFRDFLAGVGGIAPGALLILMAMSVKLIITKGGIMDTILYTASEAIAGAGPYVSALLVFLLVLVLNFFVGSGSAKAFLVIPLIAPMTELLGLSRQVAVQAFCLGDGFTNLFYPTNPLLMITLSVTVVSYPKWFRFTWKLQALMAVICAAFLCLCVAVGYA